MLSSEGKFLIFIIGAQPPIFLKLRSVDRAVGCLFELVDGGCAHGGAGSRDGGMSVFGD